MRLCPQSNLAAERAEERKLRQREQVARIRHGLIAQRAARSCGDATQRARPAQYVPAVKADRVLEHVETHGARAAGLSDPQQRKRICHMSLALSLFFFFLGGVSSQQNTCAVL